MRDMTNPKSEIRNPKLIHPRNDLNDLSGKEWLKFTRSWFVCDSPRYHQNKDTALHPARFPEELVAEFVQFFTKRGAWVLDPFAGSGATLVACLERGRRAVGIELNPQYARVARQRLRRLSSPQYWRMLTANARHLRKPSLWRTTPPLPDLERRENGLPLFDFVITSPPYWNMLCHSRGGVLSKHRQRARQGLDTYYSDQRDDLGNIADYNLFVETLGQVFDAIDDLLKPRRYLVVVAQNLRTPQGDVKTLAWDLTRRIEQAFQFQGERIWCQNTKPLGIWGYPKTFVPNYHHHYCLIFRKRG